MSLFRRSKKLETAQPLNEAQEKILNAIAEKFDQAEKCTDAGEKFLLLQQIAAETDTHIWKARKSVDDHATDSGATSCLGVFASGCTGAITLGIFLNPLLLLIAAPAAITAVAVGIRREKNTRDRLTEEIGPFLEALEAQKTKASDLATALLSKDLHAIAESKYFPAVLSSLPNNLRADFAAALSGELAAVKKPEATPKNLNNGGFCL